MRGIFAGERAAKAVRVGASPALKVCLGSEQIWPVAGGGYSFTMTAGAFDILRGYMDDLAGSINAEPIPGHSVAILVSSQLGGAQLAIRGDAVALMTGKTVRIDDVEYVDGWSGWSLDDSDPEAIFTFCSWTSGHEPAFEDESVYFVEIK